MISTPDRRRIVELINTARRSGARLAPACKVARIDPRTYQEVERFRVSLQYEDSEGVLDKIASGNADQSNMLIALGQNCSFTKLLNAKPLTPISQAGSNSPAVWLMTVARLAMNEW